MLTSTRIHRLLKILAIAGLGLNLLGAVGFYIYAVPSNQLAAWLACWIAFAIGIPLYGILYEAVKLREYLRDILKALSEKH
jgi:hypothetical protein